MGGVPYRALATALVTYRVVTHKGVGAVLNDKGRLGSLGNRFLFKIPSLILLVS